MDRSQAIGAGVATSNDNDALAGCENFCRWIKLIALTTLVRLRQIIHREVDSTQFPSRNIQIARGFGASSQKYRIEFALQILLLLFALPKTPRMSLTNSDRFASTVG